MDEDEIMRTLDTVAPRGRSVPDWAKYVGIGKSTARLLIKEGKVLASKIRGRTVILHEDSEAYLESIRPAR